MNRSRLPRILSIVGTRPEAVKMAPVVRALRARSDSVEHLLVNSGQHREMVVPMLAAFDLAADIDLALGEPDQTLAGFAARALEAFAELFERTHPDAVLVQGDTTTVMTAALAAFYAGVRVGHVEAGLRTHERRSPFPEEMNRRVTATLADWHFAPTGRAVANLRAEGVEESAIHHVGNTVVDALAMIDLDGAEPPIVAALAPERRVILVTAHRRESFGEPLRAICRALARIARERSDVEIVYPVHPNPAVESTAREVLGGLERVHLVAPLSYRELLATMRRSTLVLTDSGGIQEEAPSMKVPVLVLRETTERPELVEAGAGKVVGTDEETIVASALALLDDERARRAMTEIANPFGDGHAAERIAAILERDLGMPILSAPSSPHRTLEHP